MKWIILVVIILVIVLLFKGAKPENFRPKLAQKIQDKGFSESKAYVIRQGQSVEADDAFHAWTSGTLSQMVDALEKKTNLVDRHFLLMRIVDQTYKNRRNSEDSEVLRKVAEIHLAEFPKIKPALKKEMGGILPRVTTFQKYATFLTDEGKYEKAIEVCEQAIAHGLHDGTKSGYEGRIARITKKMRV